MEAKLIKYYANYITNSSLIQQRINVSAEHAMVTPDFGNPCGFFGSPYINRCQGVSVAGELFAHIYGPLNPPALRQSFGPQNALSFLDHLEVNKPNTKSSLVMRAGADPNLFTIDQTPFVPLHVDPLAVGLYTTAYVYLPPACQISNVETGNGTASLRTANTLCKLHVAFHGCLQNIPLIGTDYVENAGYLQWAETNNIIVLFPQASANLLNPKVHITELFFNLSMYCIRMFIAKGCWDFWGYSGLDYATKEGPQMATVNAMIQYLLNYRSDTGM